MHASMAAKRLEELKVNVYETEAALNSRLRAFDAICQASYSQKLLVILMSVNTIVMADSSPLGKAAIGGIIALKKPIKELHWIDLFD